MAQKVPKYRPPTSEPSSLLKGLGAIGALMLCIVFLLTVACFVVGFFMERTHMLTAIPGTNGGDQVTYAFWAAVVMSVLAALGLSAKWYKKLLYGLGFWFLSIGSLMIIRVVWEDFLEYRLFKGGGTVTSLEAFRAIDVEKGSKGSRHAKLASPGFRATPLVSVDQQAFDTLVMRRYEARDNGILRTPEWQGSFSTNECVSLRVERKGRYARIRFDRKLRWPDFKKCSERFVAAEKERAAGESEATTAK